MNVQQQIREIIKATGWRQQKLAEHFEVSQSTVNRWLTGSEPEGHRRDAIKALYIRVVEYDEPGSSGAIPVRLISWVNASELLQPDVEFDSADAPIILEPDLDPNGDWVALRVDGDSMNRVSPHDSVIFVNRKDRRLVPGKYYVIGDGEGGATYRRYNPPNTWEPHSTNETHRALVLPSDVEAAIVGRVRKTVLKF